MMQQPLSNAYSSQISATLELDRAAGLEAVERELVRHRPRTTRALRVRCYGATSGRARRRGVHAPPEKGFRIMSLNEFAGQFLDAASLGDARALSAALEGMRPELERCILGAARKRFRLLKQARLEESDLVHHVFQRLLEKPPTNRGANVPAAVMLSWVRCVVVRYLLDRRAIMDREPLDESEGDSSGAAVDGEERGAIEDDLDTMRMITRARQCADEHLSRYKYLREVFLALAEDPEMTARDLARRLGLVPADGEISEEQWRRAETYAWQLRFRALTRLAECLGVERETRDVPGRRGR